MIDWLNANDGAVTAIATILLTLLTAIYIMQNGKIIGAMREQLKLSLRIHDQDRRDLQEAQHSDAAALRALAGRLLTTLAELPYPEPEDNALRRLALWPNEDLAELSRLARSARLDVSTAAHAVRHLAGIAELCHRVKARNPSTGYGFDQREREAWRVAVRGAIDTLASLAEIPQRGLRVPPDPPIVLPSDMR